MRRLGESSSGSGDADLAGDGEQPDGDDLDEADLPDSPADIGAVCTPTGELCGDDLGCCSGRCAIPSGETDGLCALASVCEPEGTECTVAFQCCSLSCLDGECSSDAGCASVGQDCAADADCCGNACDIDRGVCVAAGGCLDAGEICGGDGACCSRTCSAEDLCVSTGICQPEGGACLVDGDCCNDACDDDSGRCADLGGCSGFGEPCSGRRECCSNLCVDVGVGVETCQFVSGCRPVGEVCADIGPESTSCCSGVWEDQGGGIGRCANTPGCQEPGEVCGEGASNNCCVEPGGEGTGSDYCLPALDGVGRCRDTLDPACRPDGEPCSLAETCCSGLCQADESGELVCGGDSEGRCVPPDGFCTSDDACCDTVLGCNSFHRCAEEPEEDDCVDIGEVCGGSDKACCSGSCGAEGCQEAVDCQPAFAECDSDLDCCDLNCLDDGTCAPRCVELGGDCLSISDCCEGFCDAEGTCSP